MEEIIALEDRRVEAMIKGDVQALNEILAENPNHGPARSAADRLFAFRTSGPAILNLSLVAAGRPFRPDAL